MYKVVPLSKIRLAAGHPGIGRQARRGGRSGVGPHSGETVLIHEDGVYSLYFGSVKMKAALDAGRKSLKAFVYDKLDDLSKQELLLLEGYCSATKSPVEIGSSFVSHRKQFGLTQQEFSKRVGIAPGTIHHYESLILSLAPQLGVMVEQGKLRFKEARCIADLKPLERQIEVADPFLKGEVSSVYVERVVGIAKREPDLGIGLILKRVMDNERESRRAEETPRRVETSSNQPLEHRMLAIAGELAEIVFRPAPEVQRLRLISSLRVMDSRLKAALAYLDNPSEPAPKFNRLAQTVPAPSKR